MTSSCAHDITHAAQAMAALAPLLGQLGITRVWLHGSRVQGTANLFSDWDLCLELSEVITAPEYWNLKSQMRVAIGGEVDLCSPQITNPYFIDCIQPDLNPVYCHE